MKSGALRLWIPLALVLATAAVYLPTLSYGFVYDDHAQVVDNQPRLHWSDIGSYFTSDVWSYLQMKKTNYYRPVFLAWLMVNSELIGADPLLWHLSTILVHLAVTLLVYFLAKRLLGDAIPAGIAGLLFGMHPVHVECVAWISGVTEPLCAIFALAAMLLHIRAREARDPRRKLLCNIAATVCFALAVFAKETAILLPLAIAAYEWLFPRQPAPPRRRLLASLRSALPYAGVVSLYVFVRWRALGAFAPMPTKWPVDAMVRTWPLDLFLHLRHLIWPFGYSVFYAIAPVRSWSSLGQFLLPLAIVAIAAGLLVLLSLRSQVAAFGSLLIILFLLPALDLRALSESDFMHDRYVYLPSVGFCILAAIGIGRLSARRIRLLAAVAVVLVVVLGSLTVATAAVWKDDVTLYTYAIDRYPDSFMAQEVLGAELAARGRCADALPLLKAAIANALHTHEDVSTAYINIGACYRELGELDEAQMYLRDAAALFPDMPGAFLALGVVELSRKQLDNAETHIRRALQLRTQTNLHQYHYALGEVLELKGDWKGALAEYEAEIGENPRAQGAPQRAAALRQQHPQP